MNTSASAMRDTRATTRSGTSEIRELTAIEIDAVAGGTKGAVVQAGWNLAQNKKAA